MVGGIDDLAALVGRPEASRPGVYFLLGDDGDPTSPRLYIGESENVGVRLVQHERSGDKEFAERVCVVTSKDANLTKGHIRYLESRLLAAADKMGRGRLNNDTRPSPPPLPESDQSDMERFLRNLSILLPVLGFDFFWTWRPEIPAAADATQTGAVDLVLGSDGTGGPLARGSYRDGHLTVLAGSKARAHAPNSTNIHQGQRQAHLDAGRLVQQSDGSLVFAVDIDFASPSAAAAVILDRNANGRTEWRLQKTGQTLKDYQTSQLPPDEAA